MKDVKFERELKLLLCYIREYGIQHSNISIKEPYESDIHNRFVVMYIRDLCLLKEM